MSDICEFLHKYLRGKDEINKYAISSLPMRVTCLIIYHIIVEKHDRD